MIDEKLNDPSSQEKAPVSLGERITDKFKDWVAKFDGVRSFTPPEKSAVFSAAKIELVNSPDARGADRAQHRFEVADVWDDDMREAAVELNRADPNMPRASFEGALNFLDNYGADFADGAREAKARGEDYADLETQATQVAMHRDKAEGGDLESLQWLMRDIEEQLKLMGAWEDREGEMSASHQKEVEDLRRVRDALYIRHEQELKKQEASVVAEAESVTKQASEASAREAVAAALNPEKPEAEDPKRKLGEAMIKTMDALQSDGVRELFKEELGSVDDLPPEQALELARGLSVLNREYLYNKKPRSTEGLSGQEALIAAQKVQREYAAAVKELVVRHSTR